MLKVVSGTDHVKAMDTLSVLTFVEAMLQYGRHDSSVSKNSVEPVAGYLFPEAFKIPGFVLNVLSEAKDVLLERLDQFISEEVQWIQSGKGGLADAKMLGVFPAVAKFPAFLDVVENFSGLEVKRITIFVSFASNVLTKCSTVVSVCRENCNYHWQ